MKLKYRLLWIIAVLSASKHSIAGAGATGVAMAIVGPVFGLDPVLWSVSAAGAVIGKFKNPATSRTDTVINGILSVMIGGLGAPVLMYVASVMKYAPPYQAELLTALVLAITWPFIVKRIPRLFDKTESKFLSKD